MVLRSIRQALLAVFFISIVNCGGGSGNGSTGTGPTPIPTVVLSPTPSPTQVPTLTPTPTSTPISTPAPTSTPEPTQTPIATSTPVPTAAPTVTPTATPMPTPGPSADTARFNQLGFYPNSNKKAVFPSGAENAFSLRNPEGERVFEGTLSSTQRWEPSQEDVQLADFSAFQQTGSFELWRGETRDRAVEITDNPYRDTLRDALRAYYFNRASTELTEPFAGDWARAAGHPDTHVQVHSSAASASRPTGTVISAPKGWYDAGDYNKYVVNSGISTYTLMVALEHYPTVLSGLDTNIPESGNTVPDILDEVMWNLEWLLAMQDPGDGGVYHKLTTQRFADRIMPDQSTAQRYVVQKSTTAALNFAGVMAKASQVYSDYGTQFPDFSANALEAARDAWDWAVANDNVPYQQPADIRTGEYGDNSFNDEFAWAAAELFLATGESEFWDVFNSRSAGISVPGWQNVRALGYISLLDNPGALPSGAETGLRNAFLNLANTLRNNAENSAYGVVMTSGDFYWGSNTNAMNQSLILLQAFRLTDNAAYFGAAIDNLDYILGRNPLGFSYVTGAGWNAPQNIHHRPSDADGVAAPVPGFLVGGPHSGQQDGCSYASDLPALSYLDDWCSYSTNEVTINWNASLVYVLGAAIHQLD